MFEYNSLLILVIALFLTYNSYRSIKGTKFNRGSTFFRIILYLLILAYSVASSNYSYYLIGAIALAVVLGALAGVRYGEGVRFYHKKGEVHYQRSPIIVITWLIAILIRVILTILALNTFLPNFIIDIALAFTTGLMAGEAVHIARGYAAHTSKNKK